MFLLLNIRKDKILILALKNEIDNRVRNQMLFLDALRSFHFKNERILWNNITNSKWEEFSTDEVQKIYDNLFG